MIDVEQLFEAYRANRLELGDRFAGSMAWKTVSGRRYLYRKLDNVWRSLGAEDDRSMQPMPPSMADATRPAPDERRWTTASAMAPVNRAPGPGRVPRIPARLLRWIDRAGLLGKTLKVAGTRALHAYERMGGVHLGEEAVSTMDIDLLYDARASLRVVSVDVGRDGLMGLLVRQDNSLRAVGVNGFRAVNDQGFMVDLIMPLVHRPSDRLVRSRIGESVLDLTAVETENLSWLENVPVIERTVIDESGYPLRIVAPDPRAFACHKAWIACRADREPLKQRRDNL